MIGSLLTLSTWHSTKSSWFHSVPTWQNCKSYVLTSLGSKVVISPPVTSKRAFLLTAFLFATVCSGHLRAQGIELDATSISSGCGGCGSETWAHTVGTGSDRILIVGASLQTTANKVTGVDWDPDGAGAAAAEALTKLGSVANSSNADAEICYLVNPTSGTGEITVTHQGNPKARSGAHSFLNVDQTTSLGTLFSATGNDTAPTVTVTGVAEGEVTVGHHRNGRGLPIRESCLLLLSKHRNSR